jgi:hypothetical protein
MAAERFEEVSDEVKDHFKEIYTSKSFPFKIGFKFVGDTKLKQVVKIQKLSDMYQFMLDKEILVLVNEDLYDKLDEESRNILFEQELDKITINSETGKITMNKPDLVTFSPIMKKYGTEAVLRANQVESLATEQSEDLESQFH